MDLLDFLPKSIVPVKLQSLTLFNSTHSCFIKQMYTKLTLYRLKDGNITFC